MHDTPRGHRPAARSRQSCGGSPPPPRLQPGRLGDLLVDDAMVGRGNLPARFIASQYSWPGACSSAASPGATGRRRAAPVPGACPWRSCCSVGDGEAHAAAAAVRQQRQILAGRHTIQRIGLGDLQRAELDKVIARTGGAQLPRGFVLQACAACGNASQSASSITSSSCDGFHSTPAPKRVFCAILSRTCPSAGPAQWATLEHGQAHAAGDVHADGIRDHRASVASTPPIGRP